VIPCECVQPDAPGWLLNYIKKIKLLIAGVAIKLLMVHGALSVHHVQESFDIYQESNWAGLLLILKKFPTFPLSSTPNDVKNEESVPV
jgi:hypothetical protein